VGLEINANHVHSATDGYVTGVASPLHLGKATHVWDIKIYDEKERMICVGRLTMAIIEKRDFTRPRSL
jgi:1,4-dihydroxy-2-naphthoyl-CoA hydrolase